LDQESNSLKNRKKLENDIEILKATAAFSQSSIEELEAKVEIINYLNFRKILNFYLFHKVNKVENVNR